MSNESLPFSILPTATEVTLKQGTVYKEAAVGELKTGRMEEGRGTVREGNKKREREVNFISYTFPLI